jgi:hypothetical protein
MIEGITISARPISIFILGTNWLERVAKIVSEPRI